MEQFFINDQGRFEKSEIVDTLPDFNAVIFFFNANEKPEMWDATVPQLQAFCEENGILYEEVSSGYDRVTVRDLELTFAVEADITPYVVYEAAKAGDPVAKRIFTIMGEYIGIGLASVINLLNPEKVIIGGGVAASGDYLINPIRETVKKRAMKIAGETVEIVPAQLGNTAGVIGASLLIKS